MYKLWSARCANSPSWGGCEVREVWASKWKRWWRSTDYKDNLQPFPTREFTHLQCGSGGGNVAYKAEKRREINVGPPCFGDMGEGRWRRKRRAWLICRFINGNSTGTPCPRVVQAGIDQQKAQKELEEREMLTSIIDWPSCSYWLFFEEKIYSVTVVL